MSIDYTNVPEGQMVFCEQHSEVFLAACMAGESAMDSDRPSAIADFLKLAGIQKPKSL